MNQYIRKLELYIDGELYLETFEDHNFRVIFDIYSSVANAVGTADIRIYNLKIEDGIKQGASVRLIAGYMDSADMIFSGVVSNTFKERDGPSIVTRLTCKSGAALDNERGSTNASNGSGVTVVEMLKDLAQQWPIALSIDEDQFKDAKPIPSGYTLQGDIPKNLDDLARNYDFTWTQNLGELVIQKNDAERKTELFEINESTGMVGMPEVTRGPSGMGVNVTCRINPYIKISSRINITARFNTFNTGDPYWISNDEGLSADGEWNVFTLRYEGDTHGDAWNMYIDGMKPGTAAAPPVDATGSLIPGALTWGGRVSQEFRDAVKAMAQRQKLDPNWYMAIMAMETARSFKASQRNLAGGSATGLIQFMPQTARGLGTSTQELATMTEVEQLKYVEKYFDQYRAKIRTFADMYMAVLWPIATDWPIDLVIWVEASPTTGRYYRANSGLDINNDGQITKKEAFTKAQGFYNEGLKYAK